MSDGIEHEFRCNTVSTDTLTYVRHTKSYQVYLRMPVENRQFHHEGETHVSVDLGETELRQLLALIHQSLDMIEERKRHMP